MALNYHLNTEQIAKKLRNIHNPQMCTIRKDFFEKEFNFFKKHIQNKHVLVAGSGLGHDSFELAEYCKYITGIELIQAFVNEANENLQKVKHTNIAFVQ
jgi:protein-L-isoaspartate O-methyltransferase